MRPSCSGALGGVARGVLGLATVAARGIERGQVAMGDRDHPLAGAAANPALHPGAATSVQIGGLLDHREVPEFLPGEVPLHV